MEEKMNNDGSIESASFINDLRYYFDLFLSWLWFLLFSTVLAASIALIISMRTVPIYQASTTLLINEAPANRSADYTSILTSERLARTYAEMLTKKPVLNDVITELNLNMDVTRLQKNIQVELIRDTQLIEIIVDDTDPQRAANIANTLFEKFSEETISLQASRYAASKQNLEEQLLRIDEQIQTVTNQITIIDAESGDITVAKLEDAARINAERDNLETSLAQYRQTYASLLQSYEQVRVAEAGSTSNVVQVEPASPSSKPITPRTVVNSILAGIVGFFTAIGVILLIDALNDTIREPDQITKELKLPILGLIIRHEATDGGPIAIKEPRSPVTEAFRSLRTNIQFASVDRTIKSLLITSPSPSDGKTTITTNLGIVIAQSGRQVVLIDADMRRPFLHKQLGLVNRSGLSEMFVAERISLDELLQTSSIKNLRMISAGDIPPNPAELLGSSKLLEIIENINRNADLVIIDSPPIMAVTDLTILANRVDGVLLVVKPGITKMAAVKQSVEQLHRVGSNILGVVLNQVKLCTEQI